MTEVAQAVEAAAQPAQPDSQNATTPRRRRAIKLSRPTYPRQVVLDSLQAQHVLRRSYAKVSDSLFAIDVILQIIGDRDHVEQVEEIITGYFTAVEEALDADIARAEVALAAAQITERPVYDLPMDITLDIFSPRGAHFTNLLLKLDELMSILDALWITGNITSRDRTNTNYTWQQRLIRLAGRIIGTEKRARIAAYNKGKKADVDEAVPELNTDDEEMEAVANETESEAEAEAPEAASASKKA